MTESEIDYDTLSGLKASKRRKQALQLLVEGPRTNGEIADEMEKSTQWARIQTNWLVEHGLAECATPDKPNYRLYVSTEKGERLAEYL